MTVNRLVTAGSAVAVNPVSTQAWLPCATSSPTGRWVRRRLVTADRSAAENVVFAMTRYRPSTNWRRPAAQPAGSTPSAGGSAYRLWARM